MKQRVIVGMSGGVDSSVSALLLKQQGYDVTGVFMKNWEEKDENGECTATADYQDVRDVCDAIGIPYYTVNFSREYWDRVFSYFLAEYRRGRTPNPDVLCNKEIKFKAFLDFAMGAGADKIATGHFCTLRRDFEGRPLLCKGADPNKDQSYFLSLLSQSQLENVLFPVGNMTKAQVRQIARQAGLVTGDKKDSTGVCFIGERRFKQFLMQFLPAQPGDMCLKDGTVVGRHDGLMFYTLGQRRGLGLGGAGESWFVIDKDLENNRLIVSRGEDPSLFTTALMAENPSWVAGEPPCGQFSCMAKVRYRQADQPCRVTVLSDGRLLAQFDAPLRAVTPGQILVLYDGDVCLGGATIASPAADPAVLGQNR